MHQHSWVVPAAMLVCGLQIIGIVYVAGHHGKKGCAVGVLLQGTAVVVMCRAWYRTLKRHQDLHPHQHHLDCSLLFGRGAVMVHLSPCRGQAAQKSQSVRAVGQDSWRRGRVWPDLLACNFISNASLYVGRLAGTVKYEGHLESKERFAIQRYLLVIGKKQNMQVLWHTFTYFSA